MIGAFMPHSEFERRHPAILSMEEQYEQNRQAQHVRRFGSLDSYKPIRQFPCAGVLNVIDERDAIQFVACDGCTFETSLKLASEMPPRAEREPF